jgi:hypothetical protein
MNKRRLTGIFRSFEKIAEELPPVEPSGRVKNIIMHKKAICPEMLGMETVGETGLEADEEEELEKKIEEEIPGADAEVISAKKVTTMGDPEDTAAEITEECCDGDDKQSDVGELGAEFPPEKLEQLKTLIDEYTQFLEKAGAEIPMGKGIESDDNQGEEEVPTQITKNSPMNTEPKGVSAKDDQTEDRKATEESQSGEHNEKVAGEVLRETESEIEDLTDPSKAIPKNTSPKGLQIAQKRIEKKNNPDTTKAIGAAARKVPESSTIDKAKADKDSYLNMRKTSSQRTVTEEGAMLAKIKELGKQLSGKASKTGSGQKGVDALCEKPAKAEGSAPKQDAPPKG